jgi:single-stranded DNA-binding protein
MADTNYIGSIVKIVETPKQRILTNNISMTRFRVQLPQIRKNKIVNLVVWGNLANEVVNYYKINDYILIEGYLALNKKQVLPRVEITVLKVYPFLLSFNRSISKS